MNEHPLYSLSERYIANSAFSNNTITSYKIAFKHYIAFLEKHNITIAKTSDVIKFRQMKRDLGHSPHYITVHMSALRGLYRYLRLNINALNLPTHYAYDIMEPIRNERINRSLNKPVLTLAQAKQLLMITKEKRKAFWDYRNYAIIYLMLTSGLSPHDVIYAKREDYFLHNDFPFLVVKENRNTSTMTTIPMSKNAQQALDEYLALRKDTNNYLFITRKNTGKTGHLSRTFFQTMFRRVLEDAGLDHLGITPHGLRHTAAVLNLLRGGSLEQTRRLMRHVSIESTLMYHAYVSRMTQNSEQTIEAFILKEVGVEDTLWTFFF